MASGFSAVALGSGFRGFRAGAFHPLEFDSEGRVRTSHAHVDSLTEVGVKC